MNDELQKERVLLERLRVKYGVEIRGIARRRYWLSQDTAAVKRLLADGFTIRSIAEIARCSERTVQDVKKGKKDFAIDES